MSNRLNRKARKAGGRVTGSHGWKNIVGSLHFSALEIPIERNGVAVTQAVMRITPTMMTDEARQPIDITPDLVVAILANFSTWLLALQQQGGFAPPAPPSDERKRQYGKEGSGGDMSRKEGESREDWTARIRLQNVGTDLSDVKEGEEGKVGR